MVIQSTCLSKLVEQECHTEGEVYASDGVMSDFSLTEPARSRRESRVNSATLSGLGGDQIMSAGADDVNRSIVTLQRNMFAVNV